jgi:hypothetical protein
MAPDSRPSRKTPPGRGERILASLVAGAGFEQIGAKEKLSRRRAERIVHDQLGRRWVAPAQDFARLQIARLEYIILKLSARVREGEVGAIDRALKALDRLDRYHGFTRASRMIEPYGEEERERLLNKINQVAARLQSDKPEE